MLKLMNKRVRVKQFMYAASWMVLATFGFIMLHANQSIVRAADNNLSNGITVDSAGDGADGNVGDGICSTTIDGLGDCTLRAAIAESNFEAGTQTINFAITGLADFTIGGQSGYTISVNSGLPDITDTVIINGYSQLGAVANSAVAPSPLNGRLLIELSGAGAGAANGISFSGAGDNSQIKGLVINGFNQGDAVHVLADNISVQGNYIGTDPTGSIAQPNVVGVNAIIGDPNSGVNAQIGGLNATDRNLISGNTAGTTGTAGYPGTGWVIQGNYVGVAADGLTPIANSTAGGSGAFSVDFCQDVIIGGSQTGAINVIGESLGHGIAPDTVTNLLVEGNYIGLGYDGTTVLGNSTLGASGSGFAISNVSNLTIKNNRVAGWSSGGISVNGGNSNLTIESNVVHDNRSNGISVGGTNISVISNVVYDNVGSNVSVFGISAFGFVINGATVVSNKIGVKEDGTPTSNNPIGILVSGDPQNVVVGGANPGEGNTIRANNGVGIAVITLTVSAFNISIVPQKVSILGNSIIGSSPASSGPFLSGGLGIDLFEGIDTDNTPDGVPNTYTNIGPATNDVSDSDPGPNNYINFPVLHTAEQTGANLALNYDLDAADSPSGQYRIEFFANDAADASGYGEGKTFLGEVTTTNGIGNIANITLPSGTDLTGKTISSTTTALDNTTTSGFASTSEFSTNIAVAVQTTTANLADTGQDSRFPTFIGLLSLFSGAAFILWQKRTASR